LRRLEFIETFLRAKALLDNAAGPPTDIPSIHRSSNDEKSSLARSWNNHYS